MPVSEKRKMLKMGLVARTAAQIGMAKTHLTAGLQLLFPSPFPRFWLTLPCARRSQPDPRDGNGVQQYATKRGHRPLRRQRARPCVRRRPRDRAGRVGEDLELGARGGGAAGARVAALA
eukprot:1670983-Rhodomonas_salina.3